MINWITETVSERACKRLNGNPAFLLYCIHFPFFQSALLVILLTWTHLFFFRGRRAWTLTTTTVSTLWTQATGHKTSSEMLVSVCFCVCVFHLLCPCLCVVVTLLPPPAVQVWPIDLKSTPSCESWSDWRMNSSPPPTPLPCMRPEWLIYSFVFHCGLCFEKTLNVQICVCVSRYLQADPEHFDLQDLKCKFDVILLEPPLEEYYRESGISHTERFWTWDDVRIHVYLVCEGISAWCVVVSHSLFWFCRSWNWKLKRYLRSVPSSFSGAALVKAWTWAEW